MSEQKYIITEGLIKTIYAAFEDDNDIDRFAAFGGLKDMMNNPYDPDASKPLFCESQLCRDVINAHCKAVAEQVLEEVYKRLEESSHETTGEIYEVVGFDMIDIIFKEMREKQP